MRMHNDSYLVGVHKKRPALFLCKEMVKLGTTTHRFTCIRAESGPNNTHPDPFSHLNLSEYG